MKKLLLVIPALAGVLASCDTKQYESCPDARIVYDWGVTAKTNAFGEFDSLWYIINPIANVEDSLYYNGNYTDSYYESDSTRVTLRYTCTDSIYFHIDRMYSVQVNPDKLLMKVWEEHDTLGRISLLTLKRTGNSGMNYCCGPDSLFKELLREGKILKANATNVNSAAEAQGSQNYEFIFNPKGFDKAFAMADSLNSMRLKKKNLDKDTIKKDKKFKIF